MPFNDELVQNSIPNQLHIDKVGEVQKIIAAQLNFDFDAETLIREIEELRPFFEELTNATSVLEKYAELNRDQFKLVPTDQYYSVNTYDNKTGFNTGKPIKGWMGISLITHETLDIPANSSTGIRNLGLSGWNWRQIVSGSELQKTILRLPLYDLCGVRLVTLPEGAFAPIHRDNGAKSIPGVKGTTSSNNNNELWLKNGFISITLNIKNGEVPLRIFNDGQVWDYDEKCYIFNDYYLHGVPLTKTDRIQVRITGRPKPELVEQIFINENLIYNEKGLASL